jgi:hypothetical protein
MNETIPLVAKLFSSFSAFLGGISIGLFWQPKQLHKYGEFVAGLMIGGMSIGASFALCGIALRMLEIPPTDTESIMGVGYIIGICAVGVLSFIAKFFDNREGQDILEVTQELRKTRAAPKATRKPPTKPRKPRTPKEPTGK